MNRFDYIRPAIARRGHRRRRHTRRGLSRRRHQPARPDEDRRRPARRGWSTSRACRASTGSSSGPTAASAIGAMVRNADLAHDRALRPRLPGGRRGAAFGRLGAAPQRRDRRRQPHAAHALRLFPGPGERLQPPRARLGLRCPRRREPAARRARLERRTASRRIRPTSACRWSRSTRRSRSKGPGGRRDIALEDFHPPARRDPRARKRRSTPGELVVALQPAAAAAALRGHRPLPQAARAHLLRLRARLGRRRARRSTDGRIVARRASRSAGSRQSRGAPARPRRRSAVRTAPTPALRAAPPSSRSPTRGPPATTPSRSSWRAASSSAR